MSVPGFLNAVGRFSNEIHSNYHHVRIQVIDCRIQDVVDHDVVVNAANAELREGDGVNRAIWEAAIGNNPITEAAFKNALQKKKEKFCRRRGYSTLQLRAGDAVSTDAYALSRKVKGIIHAVAPDCRRNAPAITREQHARLIHAYFNAMRIAKRNSWRKIAFPFLGIGIYGIPKEMGMRIALQAILLSFEHLSYSQFDVITFAAFTQNDYECMKNIMRRNDCMLLKMKEDARPLRKKYCDVHIDIPREFLYSNAISNGVRAVRRVFNRIFRSTPTDTTSADVDSDIGSESGGDCSEDDENAVPPVIQAVTSLPFLAPPTMRSKRRLFPSAGTPVQAKRPRSIDASVFVPTASGSATQRISADDVPSDQPSLERITSLSQVIHELLRQFKEQIAENMPQRRRVSSRSGSVASDVSMVSESSGVRELSSESRRGRRSGSAASQRRQKLAAPVNYKIWSTVTPVEQVQCDHVVIQTAEKPRKKTQWLIPGLIWTHQRRSNQAKKGIIYVTRPTLSPDSAWLSEHDNVLRAYVAVLAAIHHLNSKATTLPYLGLPASRAFESAVTAGLVFTSESRLDESPPSEITICNISSSIHNSFKDCVGKESLDIAGAELTAHFELFAARAIDWMQSHDSRVNEASDFDIIANAAIASAGKILHSLQPASERRGNANREYRESPTGRDKDAVYHTDRYINQTPEKAAERKEQMRNTNNRKRHDPSRPLGAASGERTVNTAHPRFEVPSLSYLGEPKTCEYCAAISYSLNCCKDGKVRLPPLPKNPEPLHSLLTGDHPLSKAFKRDIVKLNSGHAMGAMLYQGVPVPNGEQVMKVAGSIQYQLSNVLPPVDPETRAPLFGQVYAYAPEEAAHHRGRNPHYPNLNKEVLLGLSKMLHKYNMLGRQFKKISDIVKDQNLDRRSLRERCIRLHSFTEAERQNMEREDAAHPGTLRQPEQEVKSSFLFTTDQSGAPTRYGIFVRLIHTGEANFLPYWSPLANAVFYPLLMPFGQECYRHGVHKYYFGTPQEQDAPEAGGGAEEEDEEELELLEDNLPEKQVQPVEMIPARNDEDEAAAPSALLDGFDSDEEDEAYNHNSADSAIALDELKLRDKICDLKVVLAMIGVQRDAQGGWPSPDPLPSGEQMAVLNQDAETIRSLIQRVDSNSDNEYVGDVPLEAFKSDAFVFWKLGKIIEHVEARLPVTDAAAISMFQSGVPEVPGPDVTTMADYRNDIEPCGEEAEPCDDDGAVTKAVNKRTNVSRREYHLFHMQTRDKADNALAQSGRLGQLFIIDQAMRLLRQRIENAREHLIEFYAAERHTFQFKYREIMAQRNNVALGYNFRLPAKLPGTPAYYRQKFEDSMAIIHTLGKPDLFITFTGNRDWPEIKNNLVKGTTWTSNPFLVNDVFKLKLDELKKDIVERQLFGPVACYVASIEFQKRGMPHAHILITLKDGHKLDNPAKIDKYISARIPSPPATDSPYYAEELRFNENVRDFMLHKPCENDPTSYCNQRPERLKRKKHTTCTKQFPKNYADFTTILDDGRVEFARPKDGMHYNVRNTRGEVLYDASADNRYIVSYNPFLLNKYGSHIHVECVSKVHVVKYIYKYIFKGFDRALVEFIENSEVEAGEEVGVPGRTKISGSACLPSGMPTDDRAAARIRQRTTEELHKFGLDIRKNDKRPFIAFDEGFVCEEMRQMTANEAAWIIQGYPICMLSHVVVALGVHSENAELVCFKKNAVIQAAEKAASGKPMSELTAWFKLNNDVPHARAFTFSEIPQYYLLQKTNGQKKWVRRKHVLTNLVVRVRPVNIRFLDTFAIRLLAMNRCGIKSFKQLRTTKDPQTGVETVHPTFEDAARALGLMNSQVEFEMALAEAACEKNPKQLRRMFATILLFGEATNPLSLWEDYKNDLMDRKSNRRMTTREAANDVLRREAKALWHIGSILYHHDRTLASFGLPEHITRILSVNEQRAAEDVPSDEINEIDHVTECQRKEQQMTAEQRKVYDEIIAAALDDFRSQNCFFLSGSGGCGKTFVYHAIYHRLVKEGKKVEMVAHTGIASTLLINGTTAHRRFMLKLNTEENDSSNMQLHSAAARMLKEVDAIIYDEATMSDINMYMAIDRLLKDIMESDRPFGGKLMLLGGDWKQLLPVDAGRSAVGAVNLTLKKSDLWPHFKTLTLTRNMRASGDEQYAAFLERMGNGYDGEERKLRVSIGMPALSHIPCKTAAEVIDFIYGGELLTNEDNLKNSCLLATLNEQTRIFNDLVVDRLPGSAKTYFGIDTPTEFVGIQCPPEYYAEEMESGMPPHKLRLKVGAVVILLRNLNVGGGLCNGTRMLIVEMKERFLRCKLISTTHAGEEAWIPKCSLSPANPKKGKQSYSRLQFPIRLAYAMTVNKSQGQTFERVGIILENNVFAHGQLYVAMSRARCSMNVRMYTFDAEHSLVDKMGNLRLIRPVNRVDTSILDESSVPSMRMPIVPPSKRILITLPASENDLETTAVPVVQLENSTPIQPDACTVAIPSAPPATSSSLQSPISALSQDLLASELNSPASSMRHASRQTPGSSGASAPPLHLSRVPIITSLPPRITRYLAGHLDYEKAKHLLLPNAVGTNCFIHASLQCLRRLYDIAPELNTGTVAMAIRPFLESCGIRHTTTLRELLGRYIRAYETPQAKEKREQKEAAAAAKKAGRKPQAQVVSSLPAVSAIATRAGPGPNLQHHDIDEFITHFIDRFAPQCIASFFHLTEYSSLMCLACETVTNFCNIPVLTYTGCIGQGADIDIEGSFVRQREEVERRCEAAGCTASARGINLSEKIVETKAENNRYLWVRIENFNQRTNRRLHPRFKNRSEIDKLQVSGSRWKMVAATIHLYGMHPSDSGHFVAFTRDDNNVWWEHEDDRDAIRHDTFPDTLDGLSDIFFERIQ